MSSPTLHFLLNLATSKFNGTRTTIFSELNRIDGQPMEFDWKTFPEFTTVANLSMFNDIVWDARGNDELCVNNAKTIKEYAERFPRGH